VRTLADGVAIERERRIVTPGQQPNAATAVRELITLDRVSAERLQREGRRVGLSPAGVRTVPATADHVGSTVVMLRA
jgi:hypothetical protein